MRRGGDGFMMRPCYPNIILGMLIDNDEPVKIIIIIIIILIRVTDRYNLTDIL